MTQPRIAIIGLGLIGGSMGLALKAGAKALHLVGHDIDHGKNKQAQKMGAVDESTVSLLDACQDADLVIIATPLIAVRETMQVIGPHLKPGCVVTDTAKLKKPVLGWAAELLPDGIAFVGGDPVLNPAAHSDDLMAPQGLESARPDLFQGAFYFLCPPLDVAPTAVKRVTDMVNLLHARPFFVDPVEHDGVHAAIEELPALTGLALMQTVGEAPGWQEARKMADHIFGMATASLTGDAETHRAQMLLNASHLLPRLDTLMQRLTQLREWLAAQDPTALEQAFERTLSVRERWLKERALAEWDEELGELQISDALDSLGNAFGLGLAPRKPKGSQGSKGS